MRRLRPFFNHLDKRSFRSRDEEEVAGYSELISTIFENYEEIPLSENYVKQLHQILLKFSSKDERHRGEYKIDSNRVAIYDATGHELGTIFETASPFDTPHLMRSLIQWTNDTLADRFLHPILTIGIFIVHFLSYFFQLISISNRSAMRNRLLFLYMYKNTKNVKI